MRTCDAGSDDFSRLQFRSPRIKIGLFSDIAEITSLKSV